MLACYLLEWYRLNKRELPWRETADPYKIWLSEIILQQTRVSQGLNYYHAFVEQFPSLAHLAQASLADVLKLWQGLGYYSRARNMHCAALYVYSDCKGVFPTTYEELLKLPGVGVYTAAAIASIAYNEVVAAVDGNVIRVVARLNNMLEPVDNGKAQKVIQKFAQRLISQKYPGEFNQAMMELGALICTPKKTDCLNCPVSSMCSAFAKGTQLQIPKKGKKTVQRKRYFYYVVFIGNGSTVVQQRVGKDIWEGLYEFPLLEFDSEMQLPELLDAIRERFDFIPKIESTIKVQGPIKHVLTHQVLCAHFITITLKGALPESVLSVPLQAVKKYPVSRLIEKYLKMDKNFT